MAYRIEYSGCGAPAAKKPERFLRLQAMTAAFLLLFVLMVRAWFPAGAERLREVFLPKPPTATQDAFHTLLGDLRSGEPFGEALTAFCQQVIDDAAAQ